MHMYFKIRFILENMPGHSLPRTILHTAQAEGVSKLLVAQHEGYRGFLPGKPMPKCGALSVLPHGYPFRMITGSLIQSLSYSCRKRKSLKKSWEDLSCDTG